MSVQYGRMRSARWAIAAVLLAALALVGDAELAFTVAPALLVAALPFAGRFPGEALIVARRAARAVRLRPVRTLWPPRRAVALTSLLERSPRCLRGPPVAA
jgi:hypothetical protein